MGSETNILHQPDQTPVLRNMMPRLTKRGFSSSQHLTSTNPKLASYIRSQQQSQRKLQKRQFTLI